MFLGSHPPIYHYVLCIILLSFVHIFHAATWEEELTNIEAKPVPIDFLQVCFLIYIAIQLVSLVYNYKWEVVCAATLAKQAQCTQTRKYPPCVNAECNTQCVTHNTRNTVRSTRVRALYARVAFACAALYIMFTISYSLWVFIHIYTVWVAPKCFNVHPFGSGMELLSSQYLHYVTCHFASHFLLHAQLHNIPLAVHSLATTLALFTHPNTHFRKTTYQCICLFAPKMNIF